MPPGLDPSSREDEMREFSPLRAAYPVKRCTVLAKGCEAIDDAPQSVASNNGNPLKAKKEVAVQEPTEAEIQHAAYLLWIEKDRPEGSDLEHWLTANEMLCHRHGRDATTGNRALEIAAPVRKSTAKQKPSNALL